MPRLTGKRRRLPAARGGVVGPGLGARTAGTTPAAPGPAITGAPPRSPAIRGAAWTAREVCGQVACGATRRKHHGICDVCDVSGALNGRSFSRDLGGYGRRLIYAGAQC